MTSVLRAFVISMGLMSGASFALAHGGATGVVKERVDLMESIGEAMITLTAIFKGAQDYDAEAVKSAAASIRDHSGERIIELFPEGSLDKTSEALPAVWEQWEEFNALAESLAVYSDALVKAADNPRDTGAGRGGNGVDAEALAGVSPDAAFKRIIKTCRGCHGKFRAKKN